MAAGNIWSTMMKMVTAAQGLQRYSDVKRQIGNFNIYQWYPGADALAGSALRKYIDTMKTQGLGEDYQNLSGAIEGIGADWKSNLTTEPSVREALRRYVGSAGEEERVRGREDIAFRAPGSMMDVFDYRGEKRKQELLRKIAQWKYWTSAGSDWMQAARKWG